MLKFWDQTVYIWLITQVNSFVYVIYHILSEVNLEIKPEPGSCIIVIQKENAFVYIRIIVDWIFKMVEKWEKLQPGLIISRHMVINSLEGILIHNDHIRVQGNAFAEDVNVVSWHISYFRECSFQHESNYWTGHYKGWR